MFGWLKRLFWREPDFIVGGADNPYMRRWHIVPRNRWINIYLHQFLRSDDDRADHDHPWAWMSILLRGEYTEFHGETSRRYKAGSILLRNACWSHRIAIEPGTTCWTLFFTGPKVREWGFLCARGWIPWQEFCAPSSKGEIGKGCGE